MVWMKITVIIKEQETDLEITENEKKISTEGLIGKIILGCLNIITEYEILLVCRIKGKTFLISPN